MPEIAVVPRRPYREPRSRYPLTPAQERLWFLDQLGQVGAAYNLPTALRVYGPLRLDALRRSFAQIVQRHESLRTRFESVDGVPCQQVVSEGIFGWRVCDLTGLQPDEREVNLQRLMQAEALERFDLGSGELLRVLLVRLDPAEHVLLVTAHHIALDGQSQGILASELSQLYDAYAQDRPVSLPDCSWQYRDFTLWHREVLQETPAFNAQLCYWKAQLSELSPLSLPFDRSRPTIATFRGARVPLAFPTELSASLAGLAVRENATLYLVLLSAFTLLLSLHCRQTDVVVGSPESGRLGPHTEPLIGLFANTLVLRTDLSGDPAFTELLSRVKRVALQAWENRQVPFERLVRELHPERDLSRQPLFQVAFAFQSVATNEFRLHGTRIEPQPREHQTAQLDLTLYLFEYDGELAGFFELATDVFESATLQRWATAFLRLLGQIAADPRRRLSTFDLLCAAERARITQDWNATRVAYPKYGAVHELFEEQAARVPEEVAVREGTRHLTYAELNGRANQLAHHLRELGAGREDIVALCVERSLEMIIGLLGILKSGAAYLPMEPNQPAERLHYLLQDAAPVCVLTQERHAPQLANARVPILTLDGDWDTIARESPANPDAGALAPGPQSLAYVMYTSGSTGRPKGVLVEQAGLLNYLQWALQAYSANTPVHAVVTSSLSFDATITSLYLPLVSGGSVRLVPEGEELETLETLLEEDDEWNLLKLSPSLLRALARRSPRVRECAGQRTFVIGGEALPATTVEQWRALAPRIRLINEYGPTETVVGCSTCEIIPALPVQEPVPVGTPVANARLYVLDDRQQTVPVGVSGEICVGGVGVTRGYLGEPALTAQWFMADPFSSAGGARMYRTGDTGRFRPDGTLEYLGRRDQQVKIRGYRIELGEIEAHLRQHPQVGEVVVIVREDKGDDPYLAAYLTPAKDGVPSTRALRDFLLNRLPHFMIPGVFVTLEALPLTRRGKVDRAALPAPVLEHSPLLEHEEPQGPVEEVLAGIWCDLLQVEQVRRQDNFFALGGHSLLVFQMVARLREWGLQGEAGALFNHATLQTLAASLGTVEGVDPRLYAEGQIPANCEQISPWMLPLVDLEPAEIERLVQAIPGGAPNIQDIYPLAPVQEGILFHHRLHPQADPYALPKLLVLESRGKLQVLLQALQSVIDRHDVLRSAFFWEDLSQPVQVVLRSAPLTVERLQLEPDREALEQLQAYITPTRQRMDLQRAPLIRVQVAADANTEKWYLLLTQHHIVVDAISTGILLSEVTAHMRGRAAQLRPPAPYRAFVARTRAMAQVAEAEAFFRSRLADVQEPTVPFGLLDVHGSGSHISEATREVPPAMSARIRESAQLHGVSVATLFHVAWASVVGQCSGREDVVFGTVLSGRLNGAGTTHRTLGITVNMLPVRLRLHEHSVRSLVEHVHWELAEVMKYESTPLTLAQRCSGLGNQGPLFSAVLNFRHRPVLQSPASDPYGSGWEGIHILPTPEFTNYPLTLCVESSSQHFTLTIQIDRRREAQRVADYVYTALESLLDALESTPAMPATALDILPHTERTLLVQGFNSNAPGSGSAA